MVAVASAATIVGDRHDGWAGPTIPLRDPQRAGARRARPPRRLPAPSVAASARPGGGERQDVGPKRAGRYLTSHRGSGGGCGGGGDCRSVLSVTVHHSFDNGGRPCRARRIPPRPPPRRLQASGCGPRRGVVAWHMQTQTRAWIELSASAATAVRQSSRGWAGAMNPISIALGGSHLGVRAVTVRAFATLPPPALQV